MASQDIANLRKNTKGIAFGKQLFSNPMSLKPQDLINGLITLGIPVSKDVQNDVAITSDSVQIIATGGAFVSDIESADSVFSYSCPPAQAIQAAMDILQRVGLVKENSPMAQVIVLGSDAAIVCSTGGANVLADLKFVMDVAIQSQIGQQIADQTAQSNLNDMLKARHKMQLDAFSKNFFDFQNGKINSFDLIGLVAEESPDYFSNYFPQYKQFFPQGLVEVYAESSYQDVFGTHTSNAKQNIGTLIHNDHFSVSNTVWQKIIKPYLDPFTGYPNSNTIDTFIDVNTLGLMSLLPPYIKTFSPNFNALDVLKSFDLTPGDFQDNAMKNIVHNKIKLSQKGRALGRFNGVQVYEQVNITSTIYNAKENKMLIADQKGILSTLLSDPETVQDLLKWGSPWWTKPEQIAMLDLKMFLEMRTFWNYWPCLSLLYQIKNDPYFEQVKLAEGFNQFSDINNPEVFSEKYRQLTFKIHGRKMNRLAIKNLQTFMGSQKLKRISGSVIGPAVIQAA